MRHLAEWGAMRIVETFTNPPSARGPTVADIATEEGKAPSDALVDIVVADDLCTSFCFAR
jgi:N-acyl-D-aspartate/D-glutamate deacylase